MILRQFKKVFQNTEFRTFATILLSAILFVSIVNYTQRGIHEGISYWTELRESAFMLVSLGTSTGLGIADYDLWPAFSKVVLIFLMIFGGCGGSTSGGLKIIRLVLIFKWVQREFKRLVNPHGVFPILMKEESVESKTADAAVGFAILYIACIIGFASLVSLFENDLFVSLSSVLACVSNMGPGFGIIGPTDNFFVLTLPTKFFLTICMLIGRLELFAFFILFMPKVWKK